jgi:hypothetical protein
MSVGGYIKNRKGSDALFSPRYYGDDLMLIACRTVIWEASDERIFPNLDMPMGVGAKVVECSLVDINGECDPGFFFGMGIDFNLVFYRHQVVGRRDFDD